MTAAPHQSWFAASTRRLSRRTRVALAVSACVHLCAVGVLGLVQLAPEPVPASPATETTILEPTDPAPALERVSLTFDLVGDATEGGSSFETPDIAIVTGGGPKLQLANTWINPGFEAGTGLPTADGLSLAERVGPAGGGTGGGSSGTGEGRGIGNGAGDGTGASFFGVAAQGRKFVFVVDASSSMRRPSFGPERTLFNRVKLEIMQSIRQLTERQQFYIVFFNNAFHAMPSTSLVDATEEAQTYYLRWMSEVQSGGLTDPESALQLALQLRPDAIYFLTDGEFKRGLVKRIAAMNRAGVAIHTVNYGSDEAENVTLREIAEQNGGTYRFVPLPKPGHETAAKSPDTAAAP